MRVEKIEGHEKSFDASGVDNSGKKHNLIKKTIEIFGEDSFMNYVEVRPSSGDESYFFKTKPDKDQIVLHFTMGYLKGDIETLTQKDYHVSVPFVIGRNGTIYNLFPSYFWSYHLGKAAVGGNRPRSRASIGIEISNIGPLKKNGDNLVTAHKDNGIYCSLAQTGFYEEKSFRNFDYYATFTDKQYDSLIVLLRYLTARYEIPRNFHGEDTRYVTSKASALLKGIVSHVNYRPTRKTDIGPAFDWDRVINGVKS
jgi:N-acetyl-anhydromuramyl-L-alanine amidase AmpD